MIRYIKKDLLTVNPKAVLVHAVNCQGVMASGIAKEFKAEFPNAFKLYANDCKLLGEWMAGTGAIYADSSKPDYAMGCLFTSQNYGAKVSPPKVVLQNTRNAVEYLLSELDEFPDHSLYSNKFNSGLFGVPWFETEKVLLDVLKKFPTVIWTVCSSPYEVKP